MTRSTEYAGIDSFVHHVDAARGRDITLLLLHGTGGDEQDLLPLGATLAPGAALLSPRGKVLERGMPRFFRRLAEGVLDQEDLAFRTMELSAWVRTAITEYALPSRVVAVGFSNGANIAASMLLRNTGVLHQAVLLSPMLPFEPDTPPVLTDIRVFIGAGMHDAMVPPAQSQRLADVLTAYGADVMMTWTPSGHGITPDELDAATHWLR